MEMNLPKRKEVKTESPIEDVMLREFHILGVYPEMQYKIGKYRVDFAFPEKLIVVECDGKEWHNSPEQKEKDQIRDEWLRNNGWIVYRVTGSEIFRNSDFYAKMILGKPLRVKVKTCDLIEIDYDNMGDDEILEAIENNKVIEMRNNELRQSYYQEYKPQMVKDVLFERYKF